MNNQLVVYYSLDGNTKFIAEQIQEELKCNILQLKPIKDLKSDSMKLAKYFWGGKQIFTNESPELMPYKVNLTKYDTLFIGTPIWAGNFAPAIKTFIKDNKIENKNIYLFCCHGGGGVGKSVKEYEKFLGGNNKIISTIDFKDPLKNSLDINKRKVIKWIEDIKVNKEK
ncbi:flavodoxin family protein [Clostridium frigidicarnis]|uniref:Flavodoxin n=1 Tax=Clostridium frigidicarnis TaxID=84698 RepID=A0A1I0WA43_9CLOT|nr:flavodoxin [Clostridium frigidicarnis]SFA85080.1 Flavodoxin [Clostridium frigidicarnis]